MYFLISGALVVLLTADVTFILLYMRAQTERTYISENEEGRTHLQSDVNSKTLDAATELPRTCKHANQTL